MFCINCGKKLIDGAKFCAYCGNKVASIEGLSENTNFKDKEQSMADLMREVTANFKKDEKQEISDGSSSRTPAEAYRAWGCPLR